MRDRSISTHTNQELVDELKFRLQGRVEHDPNQTEMFETPVRTITPYEIMKKMIDQGWKEDPETGKSNPRIDAIWKYVGFPTLTDDDSYCAATVNACLKLAGYEMSSKPAQSRSFDSYGKLAWLSLVQLGDIAVFHKIGSSTKGHVGFVHNVSGYHIEVAGANQKDKMCISQFAISGATLKLGSIRKISDMNKIGEPDWKTLEDWGLV